MDCKIFDKWFLNGGRRSVLRWSEKEVKALKGIMEYPNEENNLQIDCAKYALKPISEMLREDSGPQTDPSSITKEITKNIVRITDEAVMEYLDEKGLTLENLPKEFEQKQFPDRTEIWHNGVRILGFVTEFPKLDFNNPTYSIEYACKIIRYWRGEKDE